MIDQTQNDYWTNFWSEHGNRSSDCDPQTQVLRTLNKKPITESVWQETKNHILSQFQLKPSDHVLDLAGGNGLLAKEFAGRVQHVTLVDVSKSLLDQAGKKANITKHCADIRGLTFPSSSFNHVLFYAGLQYLTQPETCRLLRKVFDWLEPGGCFFAGDIPDAARQWKFFNTRERRKAYFQAVEQKRPIVGTWFQKDWLVNLAEEVGFESVEVVAQPQSQIYSWFRFDLRCRR